MTSQPGYQTITTHMLQPNISRSNGSQTIKFGHLQQEKYFSSKIMQKKRQGD